MKVNEKTVTVKLSNFFSIYVDSAITTTHYKRYGRVRARISSLDHCGT